MNKRLHFSSELVRVNFVRLRCRLSKIWACKNKHFVLCFFIVVAKTDFYVFKVFKESVNVVFRVFEDPELLGKRHACDVSR